MKKLLLIVSAIALFSGASLPAMASTKAKAETLCKARAEKGHVPADKMNAYMNSCVAKHTKKVAAKKSTKKETTAHAAATTPASATPAAK